MTLASDYIASFGLTRCSHWGSLGNGHGGRQFWYIKCKLIDQMFAWSSYGCPYACHMRNHACLRTRTIIDKNFDGQVWQSAKILTGWQSSKIKLLDFNIHEIYIPHNTIKQPSFKYQIFASTSPTFMVVKSFAQPDVLCKKLTYSSKDKCFENIHNWVNK